ncbi:MAG: sialidase family protein [Draconibacterium sp.]
MKVQFEDRKSGINYFLLSISILINSFIASGENNFGGKVKILTSEFIYTNAPFPQCHASTITETKERLLAAWFGGTREKNPDVCIYTSAKIDGKWSEPAMVADGIINDTLRYPCWNPVLFQIPDGTVMLFYKVGPSAQEWWGMLKTSKDQGRTWSEASRLPEDFLGPIKNKPVLTKNLRLICPSSTENPITDKWKVHFEISDDLGMTWKKVDLIDKEGKFNIIQPSILFHKNGQLQMLARSKENFVISSWSDDNGENWSQPVATELLNPNSGTDAITLKNGLQLIVFNPTRKTEGKWGGPRTPLEIAVSKDGSNWKSVYTLEDAPGEYSYPAVIQASDGSVHITYTYKRETIKHVHLKVIQE